MELTRKQVIDNLSYIADSMPDDVCAEWRDSLAYAISSLKTDEAYQLMYEGEGIYTKSDMVDMLTELKKEIEIMSDTVVEHRTVTITSWKGMQKRICDLVQAGIDKLKENKDDN